jgi:nitrate reductase cytochrome c-type subunit
MRKKLIIVNTVIVASLLLSMTLKRSSEVKLTSDDSKVTMSDTVALTLLKFKCFVCHNPDRNAVNRVAPPMFKVREHYLDNEKTTSAEFVQNILRFINDPSESNSIMPGAVRNFGLMPKMYLNEADIRKIAEYLYAVDVSSDSWYAMWEKTKDILKADESRKTYSEMGLDYAMTTKAELGKNLLNAIKQKGTENAVVFCNSKAIPLTDSMSAVLNAKIKRVSDKPRNAGNQANKEEMAVITKFKKQLEDKEKLNPIVVENENKFVGYYPIETNGMCLQCHGNTESNITTKTLQAIRKLYPKDKAIGYGENQLRGIWVVNISKIKQNK